MVFQNNIDFLNGQQHLRRTQAVCFWYCQSSRLCITAADLTPFCSLLLQDLRLHHQTELLLDLILDPLDLLPLVHSEQFLRLYKISLFHRT